MAKREQEQQQYPYRRNDGSLLIRAPQELIDEFKRAVADDDDTASRVIRAWMREYLRERRPDSR